MLVSLTINPDPLSSIINSNPLHTGEQSTEVPDCPQVFIWKNVTEYLDSGKRKIWSHTLVHACGKKNALPERGRVWSVSFCPSKAYYEVVQELSWINLQSHHTLLGLCV